MSIRNHSHITDIEIVQYSIKGNGIGYFTRRDNSVWPVEVAFTVPGDHVRVQIFRKTAGVYQSKLIQTLTLSNERITPRCLHFGMCGGCRWQHIDYNNQLKLKQEHVRNCFKGLINESVDFRQIIPAIKQWHYRNKMEFSFSSDATKNQFLGLIKNASKGKVFQLTECHLSNPWFLKAIETVKDWWKNTDLDAYHSLSNKGSLRTLTLREGQRTGDRMVNLTVSGNPDFSLHKHHIDNFVTLIRKAIEPTEPEKKLSIFLTIQQVIKGKPTQFYEMHLYGTDYIREKLYIQTDPLIEPFSLIFHISPKAFFQPNTYQAEILYSTALQMAVLPKKATVYDLYCGTGTLGICLAKKGFKVIGIELSPDAAHDARHNATSNGLDNVLILTGSVEKKLQELHIEHSLSAADLVVVDPPRAGLNQDALKHVVNLSSPKIIYISCNPITQADNIAYLIQAGYHLKTIQPVDQFPQTVHIENIAFLEK
jgi:23S rRNA (uracil1939-C5)-methyltransferase